jgi:8-oxo-dGTP pyrophosphatase MutT (NUDIX family)
VPVPVKASANQEQSFGAVVYRRRKGRVLFLLLKHNSGNHWSLAKGHAEPGETEEQTARREILEETKPLGRVLIERNVLRRVEHTALLHFSARPVDVERFALAGPQILCGRLAYLHCNDHPAIELLEVVRP